MLLQCHSEFITREVIGHSEAIGHGDMQAPSRWEKLVEEFHDIFDPRGMPVDGDIVHHIVLLPILSLTTDVNMEYLQLR